MWKNYLSPSKIIVCFSSKDETNKSYKDHLFSHSALPKNFFVFWLLRNAKMQNMLIGRRQRITTMYKTKKSDSHTKRHNNENKNIREMFKISKINHFLCVCMACDTNDFYGICGEKRKRARNMMPSHFSYFVKCLYCRLF